MKFASNPSATLASLLFTLAAAAASAQAAPAVDRARVRAETAAAVAAGQIPRGDSPGA